MTEALIRSLGAIGALLSEHCRRRLIVKIGDSCLDVLEDVFFLG